MTTQWRWLLLGLTLAAAGCGDAVSKEPEIRPVRTLVADPRPVESGWPFLKTRTSS